MGWKRQRRFWHWSQQHCPSRHLLLSSLVPSALANDAAAKGKDRLALARVYGPSGLRPSQILCAFTFIFCHFSVDLWRKKIFENMADTKRDRTRDFPPIPQSNLWCSGLRRWEQQIFRKFFAIFSKTFRTPLKIFLMTRTGLSSASILYNVFLTKNQVEKLKSAKRWKKISWQLHWNRMNFVMRQTDPSARMLFGILIINSSAFLETQR